MKRLKIGEEFFKKNATKVLVFILLLSVFIGFGFAFIRFDYDFEKFFPAEDEDTAFFNQHRKKFESDNDFLLVAIERKKGIFNAKFLAKIERLSNDIPLKVPYIQSVVSITNQKERFLFSSGLSSEKAYVDLKDLNLKRDSTRIYASKILVNSLVSEDAKSVCLFIRHEDYISKRKSDQLIKEVQALLKTYNFEAVHLAGRTVGQKFYVQIMLREMVFFVSLSAILIILFLFIAFRSGWGIIIPQFVIFLSSLWIVGLMGWLDEPINILLITLPIIMFVVAMSDVIHLVSRYLDALRQDFTKYEAIAMTIKEVGFSTFLTSLTTAIGFFTLYFVNVQPIKVFGIVTGFGVLIAFVLTIIVLPILFYIFPSPKYIHKQKNSSFWHEKLQKSFRFLFKRRIAILIVYAISTLFFLFGLLKIEANNFLMDDLSENEPLKKDFNFLDEHYGGIRPFELAVSLKDTNLSVWDPSVLQQVEKVENYLVQEYGVSVKMSLITTLKVLNRSAHSGSQSYFKLPDSKRDLKKFRRIIRIIDGGKFVHTIVDSTQQIMRINGTIPDFGNKVVTAKNKRLYKYIAAIGAGDKIDFRVTGTAHLLDKNMRYLSVSLVKGLSLSILLVALIMGMVYRSFTMMVISLIPNIVPLLAIGALMGFAGIELKTSTSIIFTIAFGIAVDDTIHLLGKFKFELAAGHSKLRALRNAYVTTGKAMILTTLVLCSGFLLLIFSSFLGTFYMGVMLSFTLFIALIADLTLLPILIILFYNPKK